MSGLEHGERAEAFLVLSVLLSRNPRQENRVLNRNPIACHRKLRVRKAAEKFSAHVYWVHTPGNFNRPIPADRVPGWNARSMRSLQFPAQFCQPQVESVLSALLNPDSSWFVRFNQHGIKQIKTNRCVLVPWWLDIKIKFQIFLARFYDKQPSHTSMHKASTR